MQHPFTDLPGFQESARPLQWRLDYFDALSSHSLYDILQLRVDVFVVEQYCPYPELDGRDQTAMHVQGYSDQGLTAYARILPPDAADRVWIGRVIVAASRRGQGDGRTLMQQAMNWVDAAYPDREVWLGAQVVSQGFYESLGFAVAGEGYLEDDIPHVPMAKRPDQAATQR